MTNQSTIDKLIEMRLTAMADAFRNQTDDPRLKEIRQTDIPGVKILLTCLHAKGTGHVSLPTACSASET